ncbi:MAG: extracellular solute-binding protein [Ruminococcaceae bacterium]|nr:extracellular solute-binding protein [Oscillospiraceae bacterium]
MRRFTAIFLAFFLIFSLFSCRKREENGPVSHAGNAVSNGNSASNGMLEHVWTGTVYELPDPWNPTSVWYDPQTGTVRTLAYAHFDYDDGEEHPYREYALFTLTEKTFLKEPVDFSAERGDADSFDIGSAVIDGDTLWTILSRVTKGNYTRFLVRRDLVTGELEERPVSELFAGSGEFLSGMKMDADGDLWIMSMSEVIAVRPDFTRLCSVVLDSPDDLTVRPDGAVFVSCHTPGGKSFARIDKATGQKTEEIPLPALFREVCFPASPEYAYLYSASGGVYGAKIGPDGSLESECLLDFVNSGMNADKERLLGTAGEEGLLFVEGDPVGRGQIVVYRPLGTVSLADITVLTVAFSRQLWDGVLQESIAQFNRTHDDARIVLLDYSTWATDSDPTAGSDRLALDMVTGLCMPDLVVGRPGEDKQIDQILKKKMYLDLAPFLESDPEVNRETLMDCVLTAFDDDGAVWCLSNYFLFETVLANRALLDRAGMGELDRWTLEEFLDFAERLPKDVVLANVPLTQDSANAMLLGDYGLGAFLDREEGTCSFDSPLFVRYLKFAAGLPKNLEEYRSKNAYGAADRNGQFDLSYTDRVALSMTSFWMYSDFTRFETAFGNKDWVMIGYPESSGSGTEVSAQNVCCITASCPAPDLAWEFLRSLVLTGQRNDGLPSTAQNMLSSLKESFAEGTEDLYRSEFIQYFDGTLESRTPKPDVPTAKEQLRRPGIVLDYTKEDTARIMAALDGAGIPLSHRIPDEVMEFVNEEMSAFFAGIGSAEDCAKKIQSRASVWMAENR